MVCITPTHNRHAGESCLPLILDSSLAESIRILFSYSMVKRQQRDSFSIHPLVHVWARSRLEEQEHQKKATEAFLIVSGAVDTGSRRVAQDWEFERRIMPHITAIEEHIGKVAMAAREALNGGYRLGRIHGHHGQYDKAMEWLRRVLGGMEKTLGDDHPDTLTTVHDLAYLFRAQGQYNKALEWYGRALSGRERVLGVDHPDTLSTVYGMAGIFRVQGQYDKALGWYERALPGAKAIGVDHTNNLETICDMAQFFRDQGQYDKALGWYERALALSEQAIGVDHPHTLAMVHDMAGARTI